MTTFDADRDVAAAFIVGARRDPGEPVDGGLPPVPERLDDEEGWAAYVAATRKPTIEQYAAAILEFCGHPYAVEREAAADSFRIMVALARESRDVDQLAYLMARRAMRRYAREVRRWDAEALRWATDQALVLMAGGR